MSDALWWESVAEGEPIELGFVKIDRVGASRDFDAGSREQAIRRRAEYQMLVEACARGYGVVEPIGWQGDGAMLFLGERSTSQTRDGEVVTSAAGLAGLLAIDLLERLFPSGFAVRLAAGSGRLQFHRQTGRMGGPELDQVGHLEHDAPTDSATLTEDVYLELPRGLREKCAFLGTTVRDGTVAHVFPSAAAGKREASHFRGDDREPERQRFLRHLAAPEFQRIQYVGLRLGRRGPPSLPLAEVFTPLQVAERERAAEAALPSEDDVPESAKPPWDLERSTRPPRPFIDIFRSNRGLVVLGDPGSGKSTLLKWLAMIAGQGRVACRRELGVDERMLPLLVGVGRLSELRLRMKEIGGSGGPTVVEALVRYFREKNAAEEEGRLRGLLEACLDAGDCLVLLDGLDEVGSGRGETLRWLESFAARFSLNRFVVTSRIVGFTGIGLPAPEATVLLQPLLDEQVRAYLKGWYRSYRAWESGLSASERHADRARADGDAKALADMLLGDGGRLGALCRNPFLLSGIALVHRAEGKLPPYRVKLYEIFAEALCQTWDEARQLSAVSRAAHLDYSSEGIPVLGGLALWMHENHPTGVAPLAEVRERIAAGLVEQRGVAQADSDAASNRFLGMVSQELQLLVPRGADAFGFLHLTFQEFFAAAYLHSTEQFERKVAEKWLDPRWEELILLGTSYMSVVQGRPKAAADLVAKVLDFQRSWITDDLRKNVILAAKMVSDAVNIDAETTARCVGEFLKLLDRPAFDALDREIETVLRRGWESPFNGAATERLIGMIVRRTGGGWHSGRAVRTRVAAARALGAIRDPRAVAPLMEALRDRDATLRRAAAEALGAIDDSRAIAELREALGDSDADVRSAAAEALGKMKGLRTVGPALGQNQIPTREVTPAHAAVSVDRGYRPQVDTLVGELLNPSWEVRRAAAVVLAGAKDAGAVDALVGRVRDERWEVRRAAVQALGAIRDPRAVTPLMDALCDQSEFVRSAAVAAFGSMGDTRAVTPLVQALTDREESVRRAAAEALGRIGDTGAVIPLTAALHDPRKLVRSVAANALGAIRDARAVAPLVEALADRYWDARRAAAEALGAIGDPAGVEPLRAALQDRYNIVRRCAADALWKLSARRTVWSADTTVAAPKGASHARKRTRAGKSVKKRPKRATPKRSPKRKKKR